MPPVKKQSRPRIDAIVRHLKAGSYDDEIEQIKAAIDERNKARQDSVMKTVRSVFGEKARVVLDEPRVNPGPTPEDSASRPSSRRPRPGGPPPSQATPDAVADALSDDLTIREAEAAAFARERELEAEMAAQTTGINPSDEEAGIESNSPVIGSMV